MTRKLCAVLIWGLAGPARAQTPAQAPVLGPVAAADVTASAAAIAWTTDVPASAEVDYGPTPGYSNTAFLNTAPSTAHRVVLTGLTAGTVYHYRARARTPAGGVSVSGDSTFTTLAAASPAGATAAPTVLIMNPAAGAVASGVVLVSANAAASAGVASVQFLLDGGELGPPLASPPYTFSWSTLGAAAGPHALAAVVRDLAGRTATSSVVTVTVDNAPPVITEAAASGVGPDGGVILWTTDEAADSQVEYGQTTDYGNTTPLNVSRVTRRAVVLSGLASEAIYHYRVKSRDAAGNLAVSENLTLITTEGPAGSGAAAAAAAPADPQEAKAPQRFLSPALADGVNDTAVFGPAAKEVSIVDLRGRKVFHAESTGSAPIVWDCRDSSGRIVPSGVYIADIVTKDSRRVQQSFAVAK